MPTYLDKISPALAENEGLTAAAVIAAGYYFFRIPQRSGNANFKKKRPCPDGLNGGTIAVEWPAGERRKIPR
jgi:hypothetical protein